MVKQFIIILLLSVRNPSADKAMWIEGSVNRKTEINKEIFGIFRLVPLVYFIIY
jgi:hypothetical protein